MFYSKWNAYAQANALTPDTLEIYKNKSHQSYDIFYTNLKYTESLLSMDKFPINIISNLI